MYQRQVTVIWGIPDKSVSAWMKLFGYIRTTYVMDEFLDGKDEFKLRRGGKKFCNVLCV